MKLPVFKAIGASFAYFMSHGLDLLKALWLPTLLFLCPGSSSKR